MNEKDRVISKVRILLADFNLTGASKNKAIKTLNISIKGMMNERICLFNNPEPASLNFITLYSLYT